MTRRTLALAGAALALAGWAEAAPAARAAPGAAADAARADWSAGPVGRWTGYARPGGSRRVREVQRRLARLGYRPGRVDGLFGPRTQRAALRFQERNGLRADGIVGRGTLRVLRARDDARRETRAPRTERRAPAAVPGPIAPPAPSPAFAPGPAPETGGLPRPLLMLLALAAAAGLAGAMRIRARSRPITVRAEEIVATSEVRELAARSAAGWPPRYSRPGDADGRSPEVQGAAPREDTAAKRISRW